MDLLKLFLLEDTKVLKRPRWIGFEGLCVIFEAAEALFHEAQDFLLIEAAGSRDCARKVSDLGRQADVVASADFAVIQNLLMPEHADFNIHFATNEMAIAYTKHSTHGSEITAENWYEILLRDGV